MHPVTVTIDHQDGAARATTAHTARGSYTTPCFMPVGTRGAIKYLSAADYERLCTGLIEVARTTAMFSGFCYTQFADTFQEANGLLRSDRTPKFPLTRIADAVRALVKQG